MDNDKINKINPKTVAKSEDQTKTAKPKRRTNRGQGKRKAGVTLQPGKGQSADQKPCLSDSKSETGSTNDVPQGEVVENKVTIVGKTPPKVAKEIPRDKKPGEAKSRKKVPNKKTGGTIPADKVEVESSIDKLVKQIQENKKKKEPKMCQNFIEGKCNYKSCKFEHFTPTELELTLYRITKRSKLLEDIYKSRTNNVRIIDLLTTTTLIKLEETDTYKSVAIFACLINSIPIEAAGNIHNEQDFLTQAQTYFYKTKMIPFDFFKTNEPNVETLYVTSFFRNQLEYPVALFITKANGVLFSHSILNKYSRVSNWNTEKPVLKNGEDKVVTTVPVKTGVGDTKTPAIDEVDIQDMIIEAVEAEAIAGGNFTPEEGKDEEQKEEEEVSLLDLISKELEKHDNDIQEIIKQTGELVKEHKLEIKEPAKILKKKRDKEPPLLELPKPDLTDEINKLKGIIEYQNEHIKNIEKKYNKLIVKTDKQIEEYDEEFEAMNDKYTEYINEVNTQYQIKIKELEGFYSTQLERIQGKVEEANVIMTNHIERNDAICEEYAIENYNLRERNKELQLQVTDLNNKNEAMEKTIEDAYIYRTAKYVDLRTCYLELKKKYVTKYAGESIGNEITKLEPEEADGECTELYNRLRNNNEKLQEKIKELDSVKPVENAIVVADTESLAVDPDSISRQYLKEEFIAPNIKFYSAYKPNYIDTAEGSEMMRKLFYWLIFLINYSIDYSAIFLVLFVSLLIGFVFELMDFVIIILGSLSLEIGLFTHIIMLLISLIVTIKFALKWQDSNFVHKVCTYLLIKYESYCRICNYYDRNNRELYANAIRDYAELHDEFYTYEDGQFVLLEGDAIPKPNEFDFRPNKDRGVSVRYKPYFRKMRTVVHEDKSKFQLLSRFVDNIDEYYRYADANNTFKGLKHAMRIVAEGNMKDRKPNYFHDTSWNMISYSLFAHNYPILQTLHRPEQVEATVNSNIARFARTNIPVDVISNMESVYRATTELCLRVWNHTRLFKGPGYKAIVEDLSLNMN